MHLPSSSIAVDDQVASPRFVVTMSIALVLCAQALWLLGNPTDAELRASLLLQLATLIVFAGWSRRATGTYLNPALLVVTAIYFWHSPFLTGHYFALGALFDYTGDIFTYGEQYVYAAVALVSLAIGLTVAGALVAHLGEPVVVARRPVAPTDDVPAFIGWLSIGATLAVALAFVAVEGRQSFDSDYFSQYTSDAPQTPLYRLYDSSKFLGVLAILLLFRTVREPRRRVLAVAAVGVLIFANLLFGSRSMPFIFGLAMLVAIDRYVRPISLWLLSGLAVGASALSFIIDQTRVNGIGLQLLNFHSTGASIDLFNIFWNAGSVIKTVLRTMAFTAQTGPMWGTSFTDSIMSVLPTPLWTALGIGAHAFHPSVWLVQNSGDVRFGAGLGYSLVGEAYLNFGLAGCLIFFPIGWFIARQFARANRSSRSFGDVHALNIAVLLSLHMRNDFIAYFRTIVWSLLLVELLRTVYGGSWKAVQPLASSVPSEA